MGFEKMLQASKSFAVQSLPVSRSDKAGHGFDTVLVGRKSAKGVKLYRRMSSRVWVYLCYDERGLVVDLED